MEQMLEKIPITTSIGKEPFVPASSMSRAQNTCEMKKKMCIKIHTGIEVFSMLLGFKCERDHLDLT